MCAIYSVPHTETGGCATRLPAHEDREDARRVFVDQAAREALSATLTPSPPRAVQTASGGLDPVQLVQLALQRGDARCALCQGQRIVRHALDRSSRA